MLLIRLRLILKALLPILLIGLAMDAFAQAVSAENAGANMQSAIDAIYNGITNHKSALLSSGRKLAMILATLMLTWYGIMSVLEGGQIHMVMGGLIRTLIIFGIVIGMMTDYGQGGVLDPVNFIEGSFNSINSMVNTVGENNLAAGLFPFFKAMHDILTTNWMPNSTGGFDLINALITTLPAIIFKALSVLILVIGIVFFAGNLMMGKIMVAIGTVLGPIMLPWVLFPPAQFLMSSWIKFMITGCMYAVVANLLASGMSKAFDIIGGMMATTTSAYDFLFLSCLVMIFSLLITFLMMQISGIAQGLISGSANADVSARMLGQSIGGAAVGAKVGTAGIMGGVGAVSGFKSGGLKGVPGGAASGVSRGWNQGRPGIRSEVAPRPTQSPPSATTKPTDKTS